MNRPFVFCCCYCLLLRFLKTAVKKSHSLSLLSGMSDLVKERPANPIEYLANYLLQHDPQRVVQQKR